MGIVFGAALDPVFREATLPLDWSVHANPSHSMWSAILDAQGRTRATIFYKASFYDRHAELHPTARYTVEVEYQGEFGKMGESHRAFVFDNATHQEIFSSKTLRRESPTDRTFLKTEDLRKEVTEWLVQHFPEFKDPTAYWD
jgi:hypothetical protein